MNSFELNPCPADAWELLGSQFTQARQDRLGRVASQRTGYVRLVLQDVNDPHNVGACMRSADAFGVLNVDILNLSEKFPKPSSTARGSRPWMQMHRFNDLDLYVRGLRDRGFKIAAAYPSATQCELDEIPCDQPLAIAFGNEQNGLHPDWAEHIDYRFTIPMQGMVESLNISVSAALTLYSITRRCQALVPPQRYFLSETERVDLLNRWAVTQSHDALHELQRLREKRQG